MDFKRIFLIVLDSVGIGEMPDAADYGDEGSDTLRALWNSGNLNVSNLAKLGLFNIDGIDYAAAQSSPAGCFGRLKEQSCGKDTTIGHWEIAGVVSKLPLPTYPRGFPPELLEEFSCRTGRGWLCNLPYSGTEVIRDYGQAQKETGKLIVYTSADSVFQIAANEEWIPLAELYRCCEIARELLAGEHGVGRVIARPFRGEYPDYTRTANRHDYSIKPPGSTMLDRLSAAGYDVIGVGKIYDIFAGSGLTDTMHISGNADGCEKTKALLSRDFNGLAFVNLVDFDMLYGHRNDVAGYTRALNVFDDWLGGFFAGMADTDLLMITADHGCDPSTPSTDHSRECVPLLVYGQTIPKGVNFGTRSSFADIAATILDLFGVESGMNSLKPLLKNRTF